MLKLKSVVFIVFIIAICSVFGKNHKLRNQLSSKNAQGQQGQEPKDQKKDQPKDDKKDKPKEDQPPKEEPPKDQPPKEEPPKDQPPKEEPPKDQPKEEQIIEEVKEALSEELYLGAEIDDKNTPFENQSRYFHDLFLSSVGEFPEDHYFLYNEAEDPLSAYNAFNDFVDSELYSTDVDGDGQVSYDEYLARLQEIAKRYSLPKEYFSEEQLREVFDYFNEDEEDSSLNKDQFAGLVQAALGLLVDHFDYVKGTPLEKLYNIREYLEILHYYLGPEQDSPPMEGEEVPEEPLDWVFELTQTLKFANNTDIEDQKKQVNIDDLEDALEWLVLNYVHAPKLNLRRNIPSYFQGNLEDLELPDFKQLAKYALNDLVQKIQNKKEELEHKLHDLEEEEFQNNGAASFLKIKSLKKSRKMKKNLKTDLSKKTKIVKKMRSKKLRKMKKTNDPTSDTINRLKNISKN